MELHESDATGTSVYEGKTYYFCSSECKEAFDEDPELYLHDRTGWSE
ncbi:MAG: YHS domain-containing protein [Gammaproteobacteria bacterium]